MSGFRLFFLFMIAFWGLLLCSTGFSIWISNRAPVPNLALLVLLYASLLGSSVLGQKSQQTPPKIDISMIVGFGFFLGYLSDLMLGTPVGFQALLFVLFSLVIRVLSGKLAGSGFLFILILGGGVTFLYQTIFVGLWYVLISPISEWNKKTILLTTLISSLMTPMMFVFLRWIDRWIVKRVGGATWG